MSTASTYTRIPTPLLIGTGAVVFLANAGLLVLQLVGSRFLAPFIGSSIETWTTVIGVFLTGIALGNWLGGRIADRFPTPRTVGVLLVLSGLSAFGMIACYEYSLGSGFYRSIPLGPRIPALAFLFCLLPAFLMSLLTPLTIKLILPDVGSAGRIAGLIFALSTLGCLIGNYFTGFWLMAEFTLNTITTGVGVSLIALSIPVFFIRRETAAAAVAHDPPAASRPTAEPEATTEPADGGWDFRNNIKLAYLVVFLASFCGMSLELTGSRVLAPIVGVSLYTWTGIIGVMLAGTCCGNYLGGVLADRGVGPAVRRFALLAGALVGAAAGPVAARQLGEGFDTNDPGRAWLEYVIRPAGAALGVLLVLPGLYLSKTRNGALANTAAVGGLLGAVLAHTAVRAIDKAFSINVFADLLREPHGPWTVHLFGFVTGAAIALLFAWDAPKRGEPVTRSAALSGSLFLGGLTTLAVLLTTGVLQYYDFMTRSSDLVDKVLAWTFGLFFVPMLMLGTVSPQVIRLSVPDVASAGRVAGSVYAWSTGGAIAGTFATGYFLIGAVGTFRALMVLAFVLTAAAFVVGRLWKNNAMLYAASIVCGGAIFGLFYIDYRPNHYDLETKYYAIKVSPLDEYNRREFALGPGERPNALKLGLDHLTHSFVDPDDPTWLGYPHEYVQGEFLELARARNPGSTRLLVIGGGGYTFPRFAEYLMPDVRVEVVEIDPGVTRVAHELLGLSRATAIRSHNMDGRQFVAERAPKGSYQLVMQDAVNDLSVPYHLMTKEYNDAVKATLTPDGAYLLTLIDSLARGELWRAAANTMRQSFAHVYLLGPDEFWSGTLDDGYEVYSGRSVYVIYGSERPLDDEGLRELREAFDRATQRRVAKAVGMMAVGSPAVALAVPETRFALSPKKRFTHALPGEILDDLLRKGKQIILTDQYCPVDNLMSGVFRERERRGR